MLLYVFVCRIYCRQHSLRFLRIPQIIYVAFEVFEMSITTYALK